MKVKEIRKEIKGRRKSVKIRFDKLIILCFIFEFATRWSVNAIDSRYGYYLLDDFGVESLLYSIIICAQSILNCLIQAYVYNLIIHKWNVPIVYASLAGSVIEVIGYIIIASAPNLVVNVIGSTIMWTGYTFAIPTSNSIISTSNAPEVQGQVLSWNSMSAQASYIICPLVLSAIYDKSHRGTYYFCAFPSGVAAIVAIIFSCMPNARTLGKSTNRELPVQQEESKGDSNQNEEKEMVAVESMMKKELEHETVNVEMSGSVVSDSIPSVIVESAKTTI